MNADITDILLTAMLAVLGFLAKVLWDLRVSVARLTVKLDDHLAAHGEWRGEERRRRP